MKLSRNILLLLLSASALPAAAQYDQTIQVEGNYVPEFIPRDRVAVFPARDKFTVESVPLDYSTRGVAAAFVPQALPLPATGWRDTRLSDRTRGYVALDMGSYLNASLSAGYRFIDTDKSTFGARLQHCSTSLFHPHLSEATDNVRRELYDETIGLYGSHIFDGKGRLDASLSYHLGCFNYYGYAPVDAPAGGTLDAPTQTLNDIAARVGWSSPAALDNITYSAALGARYFGYRALPLPGDEHLGGTRETDISLEAGVNFPTSASSALGIDLDSRLLVYDSEIADIRNYGLVSLTPYYRFCRSNVNIRLGARLDFAMNCGPRYDKYSTFHAAPAVTVDYKGGPVALFLRALGGTSLHTLAGGAEWNYYQMPALLSTRPVYAPLDLTVGAGFGPFSGFNAGVEFGWRIARDQWLGGLYMPMLNDPDFGIADARRLAGADYCGLLDDEMRIDLSGYTVGVNLGYDSGRYFKITAKGNYQPQSGKNSYFNGYDLPRWTADIEAETNPWSTLRFRLGYVYRGVRSCGGERLPDITNLNFGASYGITDRLSVRIDAVNLLCRSVQMLPGLPTERLSLSAGISCKF